MSRVCEEVLITDLVLDDPMTRSACAVLAELREGLTPEGLVAVMRAGAAEAITYTVALVSGRVVGVVGWRVMTTTYAGRKLHIDDFVVTEGARSQGIGHRLVEHLRGRAEALGCGMLDLDSRVTRFSAHRFYLRERFAIRAHHFTTAAGTGTPGSAGTTESTSSPGLD